MVRDSDCWFLNDTITFFVLFFGGFVFTMMKFNDNMEIQNDNMEMQ